MNVYGVCVCIAVNVPPSQQLYRALVSISVEEELLINNALHDRLQLVLPTRVIGCKVKQQNKT